MNGDQRDSKLKKEFNPVFSCQTQDNFHISRFQKFS